MGRPRIRPIENKTGITGEDFMWYLKSRSFEEYVNIIYPLLRLQSVYEEVYEKTEAGEKNVNNFIFVEVLSDNRRTISGVFKTIRALIDYHNSQFYNEEEKRGVFIETIETKSSKSKKSLASFIGRPRNVCLVPLIIGLEKPVIEDFIMETMGYKNRFKRFITDPFHPYNDPSDPEKRFRTFCKRTDRSKFFYINYSFRKGIGIVLPDFEERPLSRCIEDDDKVWSSPEIQLMGIMADHLTEKSSSTISPTLTRKNQSQKRDFLYKESEEIENFGEHPRIFPDGVPFNTGDIMSILNQFNSEQLNHIFDNRHENGSPSNNPFALCIKISEYVKKSERPLLNNPKYFQIGHNKVGWKRIISKRVEDIKRHGGFKKEKVSTSPEGNWGGSTINDLD